MYLKCFFLDPKYFEEIFGEENIIIDVYRENNEEASAEDASQILRIFILFPEDQNALKNAIEGGKRYVNLCILELF